MSSSSLPLIFIVLLVVTVAIAGALWYWRRKRYTLVSRSAEALGAAGAWMKAHPELQPKFAEFDGEKIHYIQMGRGPDLVLLHGIGASLFIWRFVIRRLSENYRVTAIDIPGFGRSGKNPYGDYGLNAQRARIVRFLDFIKIREASLVGSSMGGAIALWMAHEHPQRFSKVIALAPATSPELIPRQLSKVLRFAPLAHKTLNERTMKMILAYVVARRELIDAGTIEAYLEPFLDEGISVKTFLGALQLLGDRRMPKCFAGLQSKVLIIQGERDRLVTMRSIQRLAKIIGNPEIAVSTTGGHHIMEDEPEWTMSEILRFLSTN
jgi:pimeloyl-ACP methyl ester carboxylesterase